VDASPIHKPGPHIYRQFSNHTSHGCRAPDAICYDESVWKRLALRHGQEFVKHVAPAIIKPVHTLWNEVIGFLFLSFGTIFGFKTMRYVMDHDLARAAIGGFCTLLMLWYGVSSFRKARRISRS
jgi:hypothetical protein